MLLTALDLEGVHASAGSACTSGALEPSHVLLALGRDRAVAGATVRFSLGRETTEADVADAAGATARVVARLDTVAA
jgi:cysteine desulfurase